METTTQRSRTPLNRWHAERGAKLVDFGGWEMPLWYKTGAVAEHLAAISSAALFDTSHMSVLTAAGPGSFDLLQRCFTKDLAATPFAAGRCAYGAFLDERGFCLDDAIVYRFAPDRFMVVVNAGMGARIAAHLLEYRGGLAVEIRDLTGSVGKMDVQGPAAARVTARVLADPDRVFARMPYFSHQGHFERGADGDGAVIAAETPILLSRTGYTGELGFEIFLPAERLARVWERILEAGEAEGALPAGLAARDSLRAGAVLPLSHQDIGPWPFINHPWEFALPWDAERRGFTKKFVGDAVLAARETAERTLAYAGYDPRKVQGDPAVVLDADGNEIGTVLTCVADMAVGRVDGKIFSVASPGKPDGFKPRGLVCGFVRVRSRPAPGTALELRDARRSIRVEIVEDVRPDRTARRKLARMLVTKGAGEK